MLRVVLGGSLCIIINNIIIQVEALSIPRLQQRADKRVNQPALGTGEARCVEDDGIVTRGGKESSFGILDWH